MGHSPKHRLLTAFTLLLAAATAASQERPPLWIKAAPEHDVELTIPPLRDLEIVEVDDDAVAGAWSGRLGHSRVDVSWHILPAHPWRISEPELVIELLRCSLSAPTRRVCSHHDIGPVCHSMQAFLPRLGLRGNLGERSCWTGAFGAYERASFATGHLTLRGQKQEGEAGQLYALGGILADASYLVQVAARPALDAAAERQLRRWLSNAVRYSGAPRDPRWTDAELTRRWVEDVPPQLSLRHIIRSKHFVVMTSSSAGPAYGRRLDRIYRNIQKVLPFKDDPQRRRLPVYLFRDLDEYRVFARADFVRNTIGHARADYFATYYGSPSHAVHAHEAAHQIVTNRLFSIGAPGWFEEGLAEYLSAPPWQRRYTRHVARRIGLQWEDIFDTWEVRSHIKEPYAVLGLAVEFLVECPAIKLDLPSFMASLQERRSTSRLGHLSAISEIVGMTKAELSRQWSDYYRIETDIRAR